MPDIRISLFGYPRVESGKEAIVVPRRKALALLSYLGVTQSHHGRDVLASLLWPEEDSAKSYAFLRNALWVLHQTPVGSAILATRHMVGLRTDTSLWVDVVEFRRLLQTCRRHNHPDSELCPEGVVALQAAVELAATGFMAGFTADSSRAFEEWQYGESDALAQELSGALARLSDCFEANGDAETALRYAKRRLALQTLDENAYRIVMRLQARRGDRAAALRTFDDCVRILDEELSLAPTDETTTLAEEIRTRAVRAPVSRPDARIHRDLPAFRSPIVGRDADIERILALLDDDGCRLVTVTGAGGSGKTRLAVEVAGRVTRFAEGTAFVSLVDVESPALVPAAILAALGEVVERRDPGASAGSGDSRAVARHLAERDLLVVLDNAEHLARDPRWLGELVDGTSRPKFLLTSRQELAVRGEWVFPLEGLASPPTESPSLASQYPAVQLFLQAARRADARFSPTPEDFDSISSVARHLQGSPLGLELAASWVRAMSCRRIETEILKSVDFLTTDQRVVPRRHRSLRAAFQGSWDLLDRAGREAFRALSVFRGGFTAESAHQVCGATPPVLASLVAKSLLQRTPGGRYEMLEVVREYANERLRTVPEEATAVEGNHADYFLALLASQESRLKRSEQMDALALLDADEANLYAAWRCASAGRAIQPLARSAMGLFLFCDMTTRFAQGATLFRFAADASAAARDKAGRARHAYLRGLEAWFTGFVNPVEAAVRFRDSVDAASKLELNRDLAFVRVLVAFSAAGRVPSAPQIDAGSALRLFDENGLAWEAAAACDALSLLAPDTGQARAFIERSLAMREALGDHWGVAMTRFSNALLLEQEGDLEQARTEIEASIELRETLDLDPHGLCNCYIQMGEVDRRLGRLEESARNLEKALEIAVRVRGPLAEGLAQEQLAHLDLARGRTADARAHALRAAAAYEAAYRIDDALRARRLVSESTSRRKSG